MTYLTCLLVPISTASWAEKQASGTPDTSHHIASIASDPFRLDSLPSLVSMKSFIPEFLLPLSSSSMSLSSFAQPQRTALVQGPAVAISSYIPHCRLWPREFTQPGTSDDSCVVITPTPLVPAQTAFLGISYFQLPAADNMKRSPKRTILEWAEMEWIKIKQ